MSQEDGTQVLRIKLSPVTPADNSTYDKTTLELIAKTVVQAEEIERLRELIRELCDVLEYYDPGIERELIMEARKEIVE